MAVYDHEKMQIGDTIYELDHQFLTGMLAAREGKTLSCNPISKIKCEEYYDQWNLGHDVQCSLIDGEI